MSQFKTMVYEAVYEPSDIPKEPSKYEFPVHVTLERKDMYSWIISENKEAMNKIASALDIKDIKESKYGSTTSYYIKCEMYIEEITKKLNEIFPHTIKILQYDF